MPRFEDLRLVRGAGKYSDDISMPGQAIAAFVRSPHAHAMVKRIDATAARKMPGVIAVLTGADYVADGLKGAIAARQPGRRHRHQGPRVRAGKAAGAGGAAISARADRVRYPGEAVAVVIAESLFAARDAAEAVEVEYEVLPAVTDVRQGRAAPNRSGVAPRTTSRSTRTSAMPRRSRRRSTRPISWSSRASSTSASPTARWSRAPASPPTTRQTDSYTLISGNQGVHAPRMVLAESFGLPLEKIRFVCPDVGGGFGLRNNLYPEQAAILWAAKRVGRPVKWTNDRSESFLTDYAGRDLVTTARLALDQ